MDGHAECRARPNKMFSVQWTATPIVVSKRKSQCVKNGVQSKGYEVNSRARQKKSPNTQRTSYGSKAVKRDGYAEGRARKVLTRSEKTLV